MRLKWEMARWAGVALLAGLMWPAFSQTFILDVRPTTCAAWTHAQQAGSGMYQFDQIWNRARVSCGISVSRNPEVGAVDGKLFQFYDDGLILIFYPLPGTTELATRGYYLFPVRERRLSFAVVGDDLTIRLPTGATVTFLGRDGALVPGPGLRVSGGPEVFEVWNEGVILDLHEFTPEAGRSGDLPHRNRMRAVSTFIDPAGVRCEMQNAAIFDYERRESPVLRSSITAEDGSFQALPDGPIRALLQPCEVAFGFNRSIIPVPLPF